MELQIIDEWLLTILTQEQAVHIFEIIESRLKTPSTIFCTQYSLEGWHEKIDNIQITDAILDRIVHDSYKICLMEKSPSENVMSWEVNTDDFRKSSVAADGLLV